MEQLTTTHIWGEYFNLNALYLCLRELFYDFILLFIHFLKFMFTFVQIHLRSAGIERKNRNWSGNIQWKLQIEWALSQKCMYMLFRAKICRENVRFDDNLIITSENPD